jgi:hypothetical protein
MAGWAPAQLSEAKNMRKHLGNALGGRCGD